MGVETPIPTMVRSVSAPGGAPLRRISTVEENFFLLGFKTAVLHKESPGEAASARCPSLPKMTPGFLKGTELFFFVR